MRRNASSLGLHCRNCSHSSEKVLRVRSPSRGPANYVFLVYFERKKKKNRPQIALDYILSRFDTITLFTSPSKINIWPKTNELFSFFWFGWRRLLRMKTYKTWEMIDRNIRTLIALNEWLRLSYVHRIMGSPGGKHCRSLQRNVWRVVVSPLKAVSLDRECRILQRFYENRRWLMLVLWICKFLWDHCQCCEIYR